MPVQPSSTARPDDRNDLTKTASDQSGAVHAEQIDDIKKSARQGARIDFATWAAGQHAGIKDTPRQIAISGGIPFENLKHHLQALQDSLKPDAYPTSGDLLGLPLEEDQKARRREQHEREEQRRRDRQHREELAAEQRRAKTRSFLADIRTQAQEFFGEQAGEAWVFQELPDSNDHVGERELRPEQMNSISSALSAERYRLRAEAEAKAAAAATATRCLDQLRAEAARDPELRSPDRIEAWMGGTQLRLGGKRPREFCIDQRTLDNCLALLPSRSRTRGGPRRAG